MDSKTANRPNTSKGSSSPTVDVSYNADQLFEYANKVVSEAALKRKEVEQQYEEQINPIKNDLATIRDEINSIKSSQGKSLKESFTILTLFATVFIFIAINVNIFQSVQYAYEAVFFMAIIGITCGVIVSMPLFILNSIDGDKVKSNYFFKMLGVCLLFFGLIYGITYLGTNFELNIKNKNINTGSTQVIIERE